jgi:ribosomal protein S27E
MINIDCDNCGRTICNSRMISADDYAEITLSKVYSGNYTHAKLHLCKECTKEIITQIKGEEWWRKIGEGGND